MDSHLWGQNAYKEVPSSLSLQYLAALPGVDSNEHHWIRRPLLRCVNIHTPTQGSSKEYRHSLNGRTTVVAVLEMAVEVAQNLEQVGFQSPHPRRRRFLAGMRAMQAVGRKGRTTKQEA